MKQSCIKFLKFVKNTGQLLNRKEKIRRNRCVSILIIFLIKNKNSIFRHFLYVLYVYIMYVCMSLCLQNNLGIRSILIKLSESHHCMYAKPTYCLLVSTQLEVVPHSQQTTTTKNPQKWQQLLQLV